MKKHAFKFFRYCFGLVRHTGIGKIPGLKPVADFLFSSLKPNTAVIHGNKMFLDSQDSMHLSLEPYEPFETSLFIKAIKQGSTVVDIGANIGFHTLLAAKHVGKNGKVFAFEPDPDNYKLLLKNIKANNYTNITAVNKALGSKKDKLKLYKNPKNRGDHRIYDSHDGRKSITVDITTLDSYKPKNVSIIKMDVQGAEPAVVKGMKKTLKQDLVMLTEFSPKLLHLFGSSADKYIDLLEKIGFKLENIAETKNKLTKVNRKKLLQDITIENGIFTNFRCTKK